MGKNVTATIRMVLKRIPNGALQRCVDEAPNVMAAIADVSLAAALGAALAVISPAAVPVLAGAGARRDLEIDVQNYGKGLLAIIAA